ncbi:hypothetical protein B0O99DRAFT_693938 [Bisporella sp. PMI_857]|nr:hypothetical protein B0O99DRAFT_693938 [Bisporella sp. PMI_857]
MSARRSASVSASATSVCLRCAKIAGSKPEVCCFFDKRVAISALAAAALRPNLPAALRRRGGRFARWSRLFRERPGSDDRKKHFRGAIARVSSEIKNRSEALFRQQAHPKRVEAVFLAFFTEARKTNSFLRELVKLQRVAAGKEKDDDDEDKDENDDNKDDPFASEEEEEKKDNEMGGKREKRRKKNELVARVVKSALSASGVLDV